MIVIINYGLGNLGSIQNMLKKIGADAVISSSKDEIRNANKLILPGVGAFDSGVQKLQESGLMEVIAIKALQEKVPVLGVCLGMQLLMKNSAEGKMAGLGWMDGDVVRFQFTDGQNHLKIPHMGWNTVTIKKEHALLENLPPDARFYFVHSYHVKCKDEKDVLAVTNHGCEFASIVCHANIMGTQFHPEKSHKFGMQILRNFARLK